ncbi:MAG: amidohydrolase family protein [Pseudomonadota bacterium]
MRPTPASSFRLPPGACDCHVHVFDPERYPYAEDRGYTPAAADVQDLRAHLARSGMARVVLVQPSCYGLRNDAMLHALEALGSAAARGVAVVDADRVDEATLQGLHHAGVRGVRLNFSVQAQVDGGQAAPLLERAAARLAARQWHLQVHASPAMLAALQPVLARLPVRVVLDHFGGTAASSGVTLALLELPHVWLKLSAPYRASRQENHEDLRPLVERCAAIAPDRLLWGSDWPHTGGAGTRSADPDAIEPFRKTDAVASLAQLGSWLPDDGMRRRLLVDNPAALYDF